MCLAQGPQRSGAGEAQTRGLSVSEFKVIFDLSNSYTMGCPPVRGDNPRALASGFSYIQVDKTWYNYFIPPTSV